MTIQKLYRFALIAVLILTAAVASQAQESHIGGLTGHAEGAVGGRNLYMRYCWGCHSPHGNGDGENAPYLSPLPRNFVAATFKCRSTPTGTLPTDEDLYNSLTRGLVESGMPSWVELTDQQRADLVAYIKTYSPRWKSEGPGQPIQVPAESKLDLDSIKRGKDVFTKAECFKCHGEQGRGDGPSAAGLTDNNNQPIRPYDFESGTRFKCGTTNADLYKIFMTGLDGTPMPSFADVIKPAEAWDLVHYLRTLQVNLKSPELVLWESTKEGAQIVKETKASRGTPTGSGTD
jgi:mono/diheme cytochrome c family protein